MSDLSRRGRCLSRGSVERHVSQESRTGGDVSSDPERARCRWRFVGAQEGVRVAPAPAASTARTPEIPAEFGMHVHGTLHPDPVAAQAKTDQPKGHARELAFDDGKMKGRKSIASGGHAVRFDAPGDGWMLTPSASMAHATAIHGPPSEDFKVFLCDDQFQRIAEFAFPYSKFERGEAKWVTLEVKPTKLSKTFILGVDFDPAQTKGVYVSHDSQGTGRSLTGLPGETFQPFEQGDWMIRAKVQTN